MTGGANLIEPQLRQARPEDAAMLAQIGRLSFTETFGHLYRQNDLDAFLASHNEADWRRQLESPDFAVRIAEAEGEYIGYAKLGPPSLPFETNREAIELRQFYVLAPWQGRGVAPLMMNWVLEEARRRQAHEIYLSVFVDNVRARRFYERYGFRFVQPYAFMVGNHADEDHILKLELR